MELHARLVHAEAGLRVVEVRASRAGQRLGSALAEAATAQQAEDLAVARLLQRLQAASPGSTDSGWVGPSESAAGQARVAVRSTAVIRHSQQNAGPQLSQELQRPAAQAPLGGPEAADPSEAAATARPELSAGEAGPSSSADDAAAALPRTSPMDLQPASAELPGAPSVAAAPIPQEVASAARPTDPQEEPPADPEDWSQELAAVDLQLRRLGWDRDQEGLYLQRAFGHPSRSRLTRYGDLRAYLLALEGLERGSDPAVAAVPLRRSELLAQGDALLEQLGWSAEQGRALLERELQRISRQQLSDVQLLQFNMLLEGELLTRDGLAALAAPQESQR